MDDTDYALGRTIAEYDRLIEQAEMIRPLTGYLLSGSAYGFEHLSFIITETQPHGAPPLHTHKTEEAHVVLSGTMDYVIGDKRFTATAPYVARVPAGVPHTFVNSGTTPLNIIGVFPTAEMGPNPLVEK